MNVDGDYKSRIYRLEIQTLRPPSFFITKRYSPLPPPPTPMTSRYSTRADSRKRTALGDISNAGAAKKLGAKKSTTTTVVPTAPVQEATSRSSFGRGARSTAHGAYLCSLHYYCPGLCLLTEFF